MNNALLYIGGFFVLVLAALFAVPTFVDWNGYRGLFEEQATKVLGRDVRVGGTVNVRFLPSPYVKFEKIRISESAEASGEPIFRAESFKLWLAVPPLLRGVFEANEIELKRPVIRLAADASGGGNWSTLTFVPGSLPFVPKDVTLEKVNVINGILSLTSAQGQELVHIEGVNGELMSESLEGPFKFKGKMKWDGAEREWRVATAKPEANGDIRFKSTVTVPATKNTYVLDGRVADLRTKPRYEGELTAKIAIAGDAGAKIETRTLDFSKTSGEGEKPSGVDVRGKVTGDTSGFKVQDLAVSLEQGGPPQIITGQASMAWSGKMHVDVGLGSRWLDLDRAAPGGGARPMEVARGLFEGLTSLLPAEAETNASMTFDQVNLGAEAVSGVRLSVVRAGGPLELKEFRADVPGGGRLTLDGVLTVGQTPAFDGNMSLDGQSLVRFLTWALKEPRIGEGRTDSAFAVTGRMQLTDRMVAIKEAKAEFGSLPMRGDLRLDLDARRRLALTLDANKIDAGQLFPGSLSLSALGVFRGVADNAGAGEDKPKAEDAQVTPAAAAHFFDPARADIVLNIRAGQIVDGERSISNVAAALAFEGERLTVESLRFATADGLDVDVAGEMGSARVKPVGVLRGRIAAKSTAAVGTLFKLFDMNDAGKGAEAQLAELTPFNLAGTVALGQRVPDAIDVKADGVVDGGRLIAELHLQSGAKGWTAAPADLITTVEGPRAARTLSALARGSSAATGENGIISTQASRTLVIKAAGVPAKGMVSIASLQGEGLSLDYTGRISVSADGTAAASGGLRIAASDAREVLSFAGLPFGAGIAGIPLEGEADVVLEGQALTLRPRKLSIGGSTVAGSLTLDRTAGKPLHIAAKLDVDHASLPRLLTPILSAAIERPILEPPPPVPATPPGRRQAQTPQTPGPALASAALSPGIWPEQGFDLSIVDHVEGTIETRFKALALDEGLTISDARIETVIEPKKVRVTSLEGTALGGKLTSGLTIEKQPAGVGLSGRLQIGIGESSPANGETAAASTPSAFALEFSGRALSPAALMTDLKGKGEIALGDVTLSGMGPAPVAATVESALQGKGPTGGPQLTEALRAAMKQGQVRLGAIKIPVLITDGAMRLESVSLDSDEGRSTFQTAVELATMKIDSEWKIEARVKAKSEETAERIVLPAVTVVYTGKLKDFAVIDPTLETGALEREITVRKMERDVEELERLRKLDQSKAKALEEERAKAAAAAAAAEQGTPAAPPAGSASSPDALAPSDGAPAVAGEPVPAQTAVAADPAADDATQTDGSPRPQREYRPPAPVKKKPAAKKAPWNPFQLYP